MRHVPYMAWRQLGGALTKRIPRYLLRKYFLSNRDNYRYTKGTLTSEDSEESRLSDSTRRIPFALQAPERQCLDT